MNEPVNVHIQAFRDALAAVKATSPGTPYESARLVEYAASLSAAAGADMRAALKEVTQHYVEAQRSGSRDFRESVRAGWLALFRRVAATDPDMAKSILEFMEDIEEFDPLRDAAEMVSPAFRRAAPV